MQQAGDGDDARTELRPDHLDDQHGRLPRRGVRPLPLRGDEGGDSLLHPYNRADRRTVPHHRQCDPGIIETELLFQTHGDEGVAKLAATVPLGLGKPRDVGLAAAFLAGEGGNYITGACIDVNGGMYFH